MEKKIYVNCWAVADACRGAIETPAIISKSGRGKLFSHNLT